MMRLLWRSINHFERNFGALEPLHSVLEADVAVLPEGLTFQKMAAASPNQGLPQRADLVLHRLRLLAFPDAQVLVRTQKLPIRSVFQMEY